MHNDVLDQPEKKPSKKIWTLIGYIAIGFMAVGLMMRYLSWVGALWPVAISVLLMVIRFIALFPGTNSSITWWLYLIGHITLVGVVVLNVTGLLFSATLFLLPALFYLAGMLWPEDNQINDE